MARGSREGHALTCSAMREGYIGGGSPSASATAKGSHMVHAGSKRAREDPERARVNLRVDSQEITVA